MSMALRFCFHGIGSPQRPLEEGEEELWLKPGQFESLLDELQRHARIELTFDDGNASDIEHGLPTLQERGLTATFFVIADRLDQPGSLSTADVRKLVDAGMAVGSHGRRHIAWRDLSSTELADELVDARRQIATVTRQPVVDVACPLGAYDRRVLHTLRACGFRRVYTSDGLHRQSTRLIRPRYTVTHRDTPRSLRALITAPVGLGARITGDMKQRYKRWR